MTILRFIKIIIHVIAAIPDSFKIKRLRKRGQHLTAKKLTECRVRHWSLSVLITAGVTVDVFGEENIPSGNALFVPNHQSNWDIPLLLSYGPICGLLSKDSIAKIPVAKTYMNFLNCRFIDRSDPRKAIRSIKEAGNILAGGESFTIFAEGTRSKGEELGEFHNHSLMAAAKNGIDIVPVSIDGTYKIMEANHGIFIKPAHVILSFLPPVHTADMDRKDFNRLGENVREAILQERMKRRAVCDSETAGSHS